MQVLRYLSMRFLPPPYLNENKWKLFFIQQHLSEVTVSSFWYRPWLSLASTTARPPFTYSETLGNSPEWMLHLVFDQPKRACHSTGHWPPLATYGHSNQILVTGACLQSDLWVCTRLLELSQAYTPSLPLRSSKDCHLESQSRLFLFVLPWLWNKLSSAIRTGASLSVLKNLLKAHLSWEHLLF